MGDDRATSFSGWLPPLAPGAGPRPRFGGPDPAPPRPAHVAPPPAPAAGTGNTPAVWALVLSITGLALLLTSLGTLFLLTLPCSAAAWVLARRGRDRVARG